MAPLSLDSALTLQSAILLRSAKGAAPDDFRRTLPSEDMGIWLSRSLVAGKGSFVDTARRDRCNIIEQVHSMNADKPMFMISAGRSRFVKFGNDILNDAATRRDA